MREYSRHFILLLAGAIGGGLLQNTGALALWGIKPNISLAFLIAAAFFLRALSLMSAATAASLLSLELISDAAAAVLAMAVIGLGSFLLSDRLPGTPIVNAVFLAVAGTFFFYAIVDFGFLRSQGGAVLGEALYNALWGVMAFMLGRKIFRHEKAF